MSGEAAGVAGGVETPPTSCPGPVTAGIAPPPAPLGPDDDLPIPKLADVERIWVLYAMHALHGKKEAVARSLGISLKTLYNKLHRYRDEGYLP